MPRVLPYASPSQRKLAPSRHDAWIGAFVVGAVLGALMVVSCIAVVCIELYEGDEPPLGLMVSIQLATAVATGLFSWMCVSLAKRRVRANRDDL